MSADASILADEQCVVTGGTGFIGSHLCSNLEKMGAEVFNLDIEPATNGTLFPIINKGGRIKTQVMDLSNSEVIQRVIELRPSFIFHLAAEPYAPYTTCNPLNAFSANVATTANMLEVARNVKGCKFLLSSSACYFGATNSAPLSINSEISKPEHYYSYTKRMAEDLVNSYVEMYSLNASICRFSNVYGAGDRHFGRIIPSICRQLIYNTPVCLELLRSKGESTFEFLIVDDVVEGMCKTASYMYKENTGSIFHFSGGQEGRVDIINLVKIISNLYDNKIRAVNYRDNQFEKTVVKYLNYKESEDRLNWSPTINLEEGLRQTLSWYKTHIRELIEK